MFLHRGSKCGAVVIRRLRLFTCTAHQRSDPFAALDATTPSTPPPPRSIPIPSTSTLSFNKDDKPSSFVTEHASSSSSHGPFDHSPETVLDDGTTDWSRSFSGLSQEAFSKEVSEILMAHLNPEDVEIKPDGIIYLPEIKYRRILNRAFGPGAWGLAPRGPTKIGSRNVSREYALVCFGRLVSVARGEQDFFGVSSDAIPTATEGCRSNALMRCCKDLGIASELWDPNYITWWKTQYATQEWTQTNGRRRQMWSKKRKSDWKPDFIRKQQAQ